MHVDKDFCALMLSLYWVLGASSDFGWQMFERFTFPIACINAAQCAVISLCFLGLYQRSDCYSWLIMICANSARRLLRTPWLTCLRTKMVNMVCWLNPKLISQTRSSTSNLDSKNATCICYAVLVVLERIRAGLVYQVYHPRKGGESGAGSAQSQTSHILAHTY